MKLLTNLLSVQSTSFDDILMFEFIEDFLIQNNIDYYTLDGNIYATKGTATNYNCIVSHMDTVHDICENITPVIIGNNITGINAVTMEQTGIGGDDKCGIYVCLQMLLTKDNIKCAFFRDEEIGCVGSYLADMTFFKDCNIVIQCDRRGNTDIINNAAGVELMSKQFKKHIKPIMIKYGYNFANGSITDVMALKEIGLNVCAMNISCGYYNAHQKNEYINITDLQNCINLVNDIFDSVDDKFEHRHTYYHYNKKNAPIVTEKKYESYFNQKDYAVCDDCLNISDEIQSGLCPICYEWHNSAPVNRWQF